MKSILICLFLFSFVAGGTAQSVRGTHTTTPFVLGVIDTIYSAVLHETRKLNIYLPDEYSSDSTYPVIYLLDGSANEDFIHIAGLVQFCNFPWVSILPKSILVGIENVDRRRDFTFPTTISADINAYPTTGHSHAFISFIENELQPYIAEHYSVSNLRTLIGQSLGGLLATEVLFKKPELFTNYIIVSPSLWWDNESLLNKNSMILMNADNAATNVYVAVGKEGSVMENDAKKLVEILRNGNTKNLHVGFQYFADENHATIFHQAVYKAFQFLQLK